MGRKLENEIIWKIGVLTRILKKERDRLFRPLDLSPADFSVLEFLYPDKALTVPQIARRSECHPPACSKRYQPAPKTAAGGFQGQPGSRPLAVVLPDR